MMRCEIWSSRIATISIALAAFIAGTVAVVSAIFFGT